MPVFLTPIVDLPRRIKEGDDLGAMIKARVDVRAGDAVIIASTLVSKSEGRRVRLQDITPSFRATQLAEQVEKDPRMVELVLQESQFVSRSKPGLLITKHRLGFVSANAAIDRSNAGGDVLLLPMDPDASARRIANTLGCAVVISDSFGRPFRKGTTGAAIGVAGMEALLDLRGKRDLDGRPLESTRVARADQLAAAAELCMGQADEGIGAVLISGLDIPFGHGTAQDLLRAAEEDVYA